jgi:hypothetical protein
MKNEIETILDVDLELAKNCTVSRPTTDKEKKEGLRLVRAAKSLQNRVPEDLRKRREAAAEFLAEKLEHTPEKLLNNPTLALSSFIQVTQQARIQVKYNGKVADTPEWTAIRRIVFFENDSDFSGESAYYDEEPDYPKQWLDHMSEESAKYLYNHIESCGFGWTHNNFLIKHGTAPSELEGDFMKVDHSAMGNEYKPREIFFKTGALELPNFIDESDLT